MSRWKPVKQPVVGSSGKQCAKCERWFDYANYYRGYKRGYVEVCTKCIERARTRSFHAREAARKGQRRPPRQS